MKNICIVGAKASGKTTQEMIIHHSYFDIVKAVSHTTRDKRKGEQHLVDYYFISDDKFDNMLNNNEFVEYVEARGCRYGISKEELSTDVDKVFVVDKDGLRQLIQSGIDPFIVYLTCDANERLNRMDNRDGEVDLTLFEEDTKNFINEPDKYHLKIDTTNKNADEIYKEIIREYYMQRDD